MNAQVAKSLHDLKVGERLEMWEAAKVLAKGEDSSIMPALLQLLLESSELERRTAAAWTLGNLRSEEALRPFVQILNDRSEPPALRDQVAESLGYLSDPSAREAILRNLADQNADVVFSCAFALRTIGKPEDVPRLRKLAASTHLTNSYGASVAQEALEAIEEIQHRTGTNSR